ncbi:MAG: DUF3224 domain-containing protein [Pyrinomonadaceae bacterium]
MSKRVTIPFEITGWDATDYDEPQDGPKLARVSVKKVYRGEIEGESTAELLTCQGADGSAAYVAIERVTGRIGERAGTFVLQHNAIHNSADPASSKAVGIVVPNSGTGDLRGLRGTAEFRHDESGTSLTFDYAIEGE